MKLAGILKILVLALAAAVWGQQGAQASFIDEFDNPGMLSYTGSNSYHSGGSFTISGSKLNITTGNDNTFSVMTTDPMPFDINDTLTLDVPARSGSQGVFLMCSTSAIQPDGTSSFGFRFRRDGSGFARIELFPGGFLPNTFDPTPDKPAMLIIKRTSDTNFNYSIRIEGAQTYLGSFTLANLSGFYSLHVGAQAFNTAASTFVFDNLTIQPLRRIHNITRDALYDTIQLSIDDAVDGDLIEVFAGRYYEAIDFKGKAIKLFSSGGPTKTCINGNGDYHAVRCRSGEDTNTILDGFAIIGGNANGSWPDDTGGGMLNSNSSPTIANCNFSNNTAGYGGGLGNYNSSPTVNNCTFTANWAGNGGAIANDQSSPTVNNCQFFYNASTGHGGGIFNENSDPLVTNCVFHRNTAALHGGGIMNNSSSSPTVANCVFYTNTASGGGGGLANSPANGTVVANCTFYTNTASYGGGIYNYNSSSKITSCILWSNMPDEITNDSSVPTVTYSDIEGDSLYPGTGNINAAPSFANVGNIFLRLKPDSPCIDAGDSNELIDLGISLDLVGLKRFVDFTEIPDAGAGPLTFVDIGATELNYFSSKPFIINDVCGVPVSFSLKGGGWGELTGFADNRKVILHGTGEKSQLNILTKGKTETSIFGIDCEGPLKGISAKNVNLRGNINVTGSLGTLILNDAADYTITIGASANPKAAVTMKFDQVSNLTLNSEMPVKSLTATGWHGGSLNAPSVGSITAKGDKKRGILGDLYVDVEVSGGIGAVKAKDTIFGDWICNSIKSISTNEFYTTNITLNQLPDAKIPALGKLTANYLYGSKIRSKGNIGNVTAGDMTNSSCFAGTSESITGGLPAADGATFILVATIKSIKIKGIKNEPSPYYVNSNIAAPNILNLSILYPMSSNSGEPFGITSTNIKTLNIKMMDGTAIKNPKDTCAYDDMEIRLFHMTF